MGGYKQDEWNKGEKEGSGGPLPMVDGLPIHIHKEIGKGTLDDPCIMWTLKPPVRENVRTAYESFAIAQCKELGFSFLWLRSIIHDGATKRCEITGRKTGYEPGSDQDHITVHLGLLRNWISIHGHIYVIEDKQTMIPVGLVPRSERWLDTTGQPGRNPELWKWTKRRAQEEIESSRKARTTKGWRTDSEGKQENKNKFWGNSRLPKR